MPNTAELIQTGLQHHQAGRLKDAERIYRQVLEDEPQHPDALNLLGVVALQVGKGDVAADLIERAIKVKPNEPEFYNMCGEAYRSLGRFNTAVTRYEQALAIKPDFAGAHNNLGNCLREMGRLDDARASYERAIEASPTFPMSHNNLGIVLRDLGRPQEAVAHYKRALQIMPDYAEAHSNLGNALQALGRAEEAVSCHRKAVAIRPDYAEAHSNLGSALRQLGRQTEAITHFEKAIALHPHFAMAHYNYGIALDELGRPDEAASRYEKALEIDPNYAEAHHNLGNVLDQLGRREDAISNYQQAIALKADYAEAHRNLSRLDPDPDHVSRIEELLSAAALSQTDAMHCHFALGNIHAKAKDFDKAFAHYEKGNALKRTMLNYEADNTSAYVDRLINVYSKEYFVKAAGWGSDSERPVFVLGMPRSGTTLVEQILASHPQVHGAGELADFGRFEKKMALKLGTATLYPECMSLFSETAAAALADEYLETLKGHSKTATHVTDKMPDNFLRIGLIRTLFPNARIVHCRRNALDTCISNYTNYFATGNEFSFDLEDLGRFWLDYDKLMDHWHSVFGDDIFTLHYEELIADQENASRQLVEHVGLEWDDACLDFHRHERAVHSFSSQAVRQPIYAGAVQRWKRYEKHLGPLLELLTDNP